VGTTNVIQVQDWNEIRVEELKKLWLEGRSASQIARHLGGVSRNAVIGKVHRMGLGGRDRPTAPRTVSGASARRLIASKSASNQRRSGLRPPSTTTPTRTPRPELTVTASIVTLSQNDCRWPIGDPQEDGFGYCGRSREEHASYCCHHAGLAVQRRTNRAALAAQAGLIRQYSCV
jgi:GcrA cell cycle regulator